VEIDPRLRYALDNLFFHYTRKISASLYNVIKKLVDFFFFFFFWGGCGGRLMCKVPHFEASLSIHKKPFLFVSQITIVGNFTRSLLWVRT